MWMLRLKFKNACESLLKRKWQKDKICNSLAWIKYREEKLQIDTIKNKVLNKILLN